MSTTPKQMADVRGAGAVGGPMLSPAMYDCALCGAVLKDLLSHVSHKFALHYPPLPRINPGLGHRRNSSGHSGKQAVTTPADQPLAPEDPKL